MTIIVYRAGIMAADSASWINDIAVSVTNKKVFRRDDGWLIGCSGVVDEIQRFRDWFLAGGKTDVVKSLGKFNEVSGMLVSPDGKIFCLSEKTGMVPWRVQAPYSVIGCGVGFAHGCLASDKSAEETVRLAITHCADLGGKVHSVRLQTCVKRGKSKLQS